MPDHLRSLIVIVIFAMFVFHFSQKTFADTLNNKTIKVWRNTWFGVTFFAFFAHNFWVFLVTTALFIPFMIKKEPNRIAIVLLVCFAIPPIAEKIPGFGILQYFLDLDYITFLSLIALLPVFTKKNAFTFGKVPSDKFLMFFLILCLLLQFRDTTFTDALRRGFFLFAQSFLPYYAASRALNSIEDIKKSSIALVIASLIAGIIGVFEYFKHWLLYGELGSALGSGWHFGGYMDRGGELRAMASMAHPILYGYVMAISVGFYSIVSPSIKNINHRKLSLLILIGGLFASLSRGPWMGALAWVVVFILTGQKPLKRLMIMASIAAILVSLTAVIPGGEKYYNLLPFLGKTQAENVEYRQRLFNNSMIVINRYPFFGSINYLNTPEMQAMIQGEGIIDIVNTYLVYALSYGYVGVGLFIGFFMSVLLSIYKVMKKVQDKSSDVFLIGRGLIATIVCIMVTIATVSPILIAPFIYFTVTGMGIAYCKIVKEMPLKTT